MTQLERARAGEITPEMEHVAAGEGVSAGFVQEGVAAVFNARIVCLLESGWV